jgi:hypothetical protein
VSGFLQNFTNGLGVDVHASDAGHKVAAIAFHEDSIFGPVIVFVLGEHGGTERTIIATAGVEDAARVC